jgi:hypothetical protein
MPPWKETLGKAKTWQYTDCCVKTESGILNWHTVQNTSNQEDTNGSYTEQYRTGDGKSRGV